MISPRGGAENANDRSMVAKQQELEAAYRASTVYNEDEEYYDEEDDDGEDRPPEKTEQLIKRRSFKKS